MTLIINSVTGTIFGQGLTQLHFFSVWESSPSRSTVGNTSKEIQTSV